ncbi:hypothetical protein GRI62_06810 [Erythrobacter arachoides]|uniref:Porin n=1 Tax=Aurantiacibacter arachoides TaxID=1850444 RepID=A0A844ZZI7_9SPHN|nr:porin [Aurantiacibacter arachoides]MXO93315.1 hypothetical protein [Aurantiacibacter arachoides]GGD50327.1 hypothetical protein GCM10011411_07680 [Aurantiacibacter arachoides]
MRSIACLPLPALALIATPAAAQHGDRAASEAEIESLQAQVAVLSEQLAILTARIESMAQQGSPQTATTAAPPPAAASDPSAPTVAIGMDAAPEIESADGFSFKPFGRLQLDAGMTALPDGLARGDGFGAEIRRARVGVEGTIPGGFGYKIEIDVATGEAELTDALLTYEAGDVELTAGQHNTFQGLEELTSSRFTSFIERAAFTDAFGFERRLGVSAQYGSGPVLVQAGVFADTIADLPESDAWSVDGRVVYFPVVAGTQFHVGGSVHYTEVDDGGTVRYRQRPLVHFTAERLINTGTLAGDSEFGLGLELAAIRGPFHFAAEGFRQQVSGLGLADETASFHGGYIEGGLFLTRDDTRGYRGGRWNRTRPARPVGEGGIGAVQANLRYDYLELNDRRVRIVGGSQNAYQGSLVWTTTDYTRFQVNYAHIAYDEAVFALPDGTRDYSADVIGMRAEIDF